MQTFLFMSNQQNAYMEFVTMSCLEQTLFLNYYLKATWMKKLPEIALNFSR